MGFDIAYFHAYLQPQADQPEYQLVAPGDLSHYEDHHRHQKQEPQIEVHRHQDTPARTDEERDIRHPEQHRRAGATPEKYVFLH